MTGELSVDLVDPGLYAWQCIIHPYMLGAAVIDDPTTPGADFGKKLHWIDGDPIASCGRTRSCRWCSSFFIITEPSNWQIYNADQRDHVGPAVPGGADHGLQRGRVSALHPQPRRLPDARCSRNRRRSSRRRHPTEPGVGTIYYGTQWEKSAGKTKPGSITVFDAETWKMTNKWFGPSVNLNNPHNFWSDHEGEFLYSTNWYANNMTTLDRKTGAVLRELEIGPSPSHIVTRSTNDNLIIPNNGGGRVSEVDPGGTKVLAAT